MRLGLLGDAAGPRRCGPRGRGKRRRGAGLPAGLRGKKINGPRGEEAGRLGQRKREEEFHFLLISSVFQMHFQIHLKQFEV